jgi:hypothetical protein
MLAPQVGEMPTVERSQSNADGRTDTMTCGASWWRTMAVAWLYRLRVAQRPVNRSPTGLPRNVFIVVT